MSDETPVGTDAHAASPDPDDAGRGPVGRPRPAKGSFLRELPVLLVIAVVLALLINTFLVKAFFIPSGSMEQTLHGCPGCSGDRVLVNKLVYRLHDPRPGDIVVFAGPESWPRWPGRPTRCSGSCRASRAPSAWPPRGRRTSSSG